MTEGKMPEWSNGPHSKCGERVTVPRVRIPVFPRNAIRPKGTCSFGADSVSFRTEIELSSVVTARIIDLGVVRSCNRPLDRNGCGFILRYCASDKPERETRLPTAVAGWPVFTSDGRDRDYRDRYWWQRPALCDFLDRRRPRIRPGRCFSCSAEQCRFRGSSSFRPVRPQSACLH